MLVPLRAFRFPLTLIIVNQPAAKLGINSLDFEDSLQRSDAGILFFQHILKFAEQYPVSRDSPTFHNFFHQSDRGIRLAGISVCQRTSQ